VFQLGIENGGVRLWKRGTSALKNYEKGLKIISGTFITLIFFLAHVFLLIFRF
jgi:hypothetical protein